MPATTYVGHDVRSLKHEKQFLVLTLSLFLLAVCTFPAMLRHVLSSTIVLHNLISAVALPLSQSPPLQQLRIPLVPGRQASASVQVHHHHHYYYYYIIIISSIIVIVVIIIITIMMMMMMMIIIIIIFEGVGCIENTYNRSSSVLQLRGDKFRRGF